MGGRLKLGKIEVCRDREVSLEVEGEEEWIGESVWAGIAEVGGVVLVVCEIKVLEVRDEPSSKSKVRRSKPRRGSNELAVPLP